jgi:RNA 3'-terminal phosphate cyclase (ATP)
MGPAVEVTLDRPGFYPAGGGRVRVAIEPAGLSPIELLERGEVHARRVVASVAHLAGSIAARELAAAREVLGWEPACFQQRALVGAEGGSVGPGNVLTVEIACEHVTTVHTGFGEARVRAEEVGARVARSAAAWLQSGAAVDEHLADQLLLPMALAGRGSFTTVAPTPHATSQAALLAQILGVRAAIERVGERTWRAEVGR